MRPVTYLLEEAELAVLGDGQGPARGHGAHALDVPHLALLVELSVVEGEAAAGEVCRGGHRLELISEATYWARARIDSAT